MKTKLLFALLYFPLSYAMTPIVIFDTVFAPVMSADFEARHCIRLYHQKAENRQYEFHDDCYTDCGHSIKELREKYPQANPETIDEMAKIIILTRNAKLSAKKIDAIDANGEAVTFETNISNIQDTWNRQSKSNKFWWTVRYREPYTYALSALKWGLEGALMYSCARLIKHHINKNAKNTPKK